MKTEKSKVPPRNVGLFLLVAFLALGPMFYAKTWVWAIVFIVLNIAALFLIAMLSTEPKGHVA